MPKPTLLGLHHVTAITSDGQRNIEFYRDVLGLRVVKVTVNFDDPGSYHLYFGDERGSPGSAMTFFVWPGLPGRTGAGQASATAFAIPISSLDFWRKRLSNVREEIRFEQPVLCVNDPDGLPIELIGVGEIDNRRAWDKGPVPANHGIRGFHSVTLCERHPESTIALLTETLDWKKIEESNGRTRFAPSHEDRAIVPTYLDVISPPDAARATMGAGAVHHVAMRTPDDAQQVAWQERIAATGLNISPVMERIFFRSIYFRERGGVLFEIATDGPGFTATEPLESLGKRLDLPPWLESQRKEIESILPPLKL